MLGSRFCVLAMEANSAFLLPIRFFDQGVFDLITTPFTMVKPNFRSEYFQENWPVNCLYNHTVYHGGLIPAEDCVGMIRSTIQPNENMHEHPTVRIRWQYCSKSF